MATNRTLAAKSRGVALVTVMLVLAFATIAAVAVTSRLQVDIRKSENLLRADQAWLHVLGAESWAQGLLMEDWKKAPNTDHLQEDWYASLSGVEVEGGAISAQLTDLQGLFNLNNLRLTQAKNGQLPQGCIPFTQNMLVQNVHLIRFRCLLEALDLDPGLADALVDWLDANIDPVYPKGAEDDIYQGLTPAYRAANREMAHPSELLLVQGFTPEVYNRLKPYVTALPLPPVPSGGSQDPTLINVNTAPAPVLQSLASGITQQAAEKLVENREQKSWETVQDFLQAPLLAGIKLDPDEETGQGGQGGQPGQISQAGQGGIFSVQSDFFQLRTAVQVGRMQLAVSSVLERGPQPAPQGQPPGPVGVRVIQHIREGLFGG